MLENRVPALRAARVPHHARDASRDALVCNIFCTKLFNESALFFCKIKCILSFPPSHVIC